MSFLYRLLLYGFPLFLLLAEALLKFSKGAPHPATNYYVALCSAATSLLLVAAVPKDISYRFTAFQLPVGCQLRSVLDERLSAVAWTTLFITLLVWVYFLTTPELSANFAIVEFEDGRKLYTPNPLSPEFIASGVLYVIGVIATEVKGRA